MPLSKIDRYLIQLGCQSFQLVEFPLLFRLSRRGMGLLRLHSSLGYGHRLGLGMNAQHFLIVRVSCYSPSIVMNWLQLILTKRPWPVQPIQAEVISR